MASLNQASSSHTNSISEKDTPTANHSKKPWTNKIPFPEARAASSFQEAYAKNYSNLTSESIVQYIRGEQTYITPGAYHDYFSRSQDKEKAWNNLVFLITQDIYEDFTVKDMTIELHKQRFTNDSFESDYLCV